MFATRINIEKTRKKNKEKRTHVPILDESTTLHRLGSSVGHVTGKEEVVSGLHTPGESVFEYDVIEKDKIRVG